MSDKDILYSLFIAITFLIGIANWFHARKTAFINTVTSERVKWINKLRENVSEFCGLTHHWVHTELSEEESNTVLKDIDKVRIFIKLQLNPKDPTDKDLIRIIDKIPEYTHESKKEKLKELINATIISTQDLLKIEWERVKLESKRGEISSRKGSNRVARRA
ncbi:MAG: hypothetical protein CL693_00190 [Cellvibrionaceae bacterium]|nr:hypothetical protein [Cellvibrionaceae bacterium]|tara:strand:- start:569 stop:1054 length:486 start_codon:yes stop_codon:yes gene_type:complete